MTDDMIKETITFKNDQLLGKLYNHNLGNLSLVEKTLNVVLTARDNWLAIDGEPLAVEKTKHFFELLEHLKQQGLLIRNSDFSYLLNTFIEKDSATLKETFRKPKVIKLKKASIIPKTLNQKTYLKYIDENSITIAMGPAGTGKTYLAVAMALRDLSEGSVQKIVLTRPAVEAGETLGFLPGELEDKVLPYLIPLYDAMYEMIGKVETLKLIEKGIIEIAPLAYMRGRTISNAFIILDEAQNTTQEQMLMFLTRLGDASKMVITGDHTQIDLPKTKFSGLLEASEVLKETSDIEVFRLKTEDVVRNPLVKKIIDAYKNAGHAK